MKTIQITMNIDDKQGMMNALQLALTEGEKFAKAMFDELIDYWGADKCGIDQMGLIEAGTGHFIHCCQKGIKLGDPAEYIVDCLSRYSDIGLAKCGLTREQYNEVANEIT